MIIGNLEFASNMFLAPMAEVSYAPMRRISKDFGAGLTFTQMVSAEGVIKNNFNTLRYLTFNRDEKPIGVQILGKNSELIKDATSEIAKFNPNIIDLNAGCSVEKVCNLKMGCKLMDYPDLLGKIVRGMSDGAGNIPVSVKMRLGSTRDKINVAEIAKVCENNGASMLFVHARTRDNSYIDEPDWSWLKKVKQEVKIPVIGNGSIFTPQDAVKMIDETGVDGVMVSRGALGNPFIFSRFNSIIHTGSDPGEPTPELIQQTALRHLSYTIEDFGEVEAVRRCKKDIIWYYRNYQNLQKFVDTILRCRDIPQLQDAIAKKTKRAESEKENIEEINEYDRKFKERVMFWVQNK